MQIDVSYPLGTGKCTAVSSGGLSTVDHSWKEERMGTERNREKHLYLGDRFGLICHTGFRTASAGFNHPGYHYFSMLGVHLHDYRKRWSDG